MNEKAFWVALLALLFLVAACDGVTNTGTGSGSDTAGTGSGDDAAVSASDATGGGTEDGGLPGEDTPAVCQPNCAGKACGDDGCGGLCEPGCTGDETCENFQCIPPDIACTDADRAAACADKECGGDGCGGLCGDCEAPLTCDFGGGRCTCQSDCSGRQCGPDPVCGVSCGMCADGGTCGDDGRCVANYPAGPYGVEVGDTIDNLVFYTADGRAVELAQYYGQEKVIILSSAAGWCTVCQAEAQELNDFYALYDDRGLIILYTLFEDERGNPISGDFVRTWIGWFDLDYPVFQDRDLAMLPFYDQNATPLNMVVTTSDMQIRYREVGYSDFQVTYWAKKYMYE